MAVYNILLKNLLEKYKQLKKRERIAVIVLAVMAALAVYYNMIYMPLSRNTKTYISQTERLNKQLLTIETQHPEIQARLERIEAKEAEEKKTLDEIEEMENRLPSKKATSRLISEFTRLAKNIKIDSIRQKIDKGDEYFRIFVEIQFDASFNDIFRYIERIETISPFLKVEELEINEPRSRKKEKGGLIRLVISSLLGDVPFSEQLKAKELEKGAVSSELRDIFVSQVRPEATKTKIDMKLEGITYNEDVATGIINGEVVKEGSVIDGYTVKKILFDKITLTDGIEKYVLCVER